jgi:hypothetical protein
MSLMKKMAKMLQEDQKQLSKKAGYGSTAEEKQTLGPVFDGICAKINEARDLLNKAAQQYPDQFSDVGPECAYELKQVCDEIKNLKSAFLD